MDIPFRRYWVLLKRYLQPQKWRVAGLLGVVLLGIGLRLLNPQVIRFFIDSAVSGQSTLSQLWQAAFAYIGIALVIQALSVLATYLGENIGWTATNQLREDLAHHCLHLDISFHKNHTPGELMERIDGDVTLLANFFAQFTVRVMGNVLLVLGVLLLLFWEDVRVGAAVTAVYLLSFVVLGRLQGVAVPRWTAARQVSAELFGFLEERLTATEDIAGNKTGAHTLRQLGDILGRYAHKFRLARLADDLIFVLTLGIFFMADAVGLAVSVYLYTVGVLTIGTVYLVYNYTGVLSTPLEEIREQIQDLQRASASIGRIQHLFAAQPAVIDGQNGRLPDGPLAVALENVSFRYLDQPTTPTLSLDDEPVLPTPRTLHDLTLHLAAGETLGLLGRTGSGKTTLTRLIFRLYDVENGRICLNHQDVREVPLADLRRRVGMVTQDVQLFQASVRDNLTFFDSTIKDDQILQAIQTLNLTAWLAALPNGLDTVLQGSGGLSAGEAQLLAFTRLLLRQPGLVILDEPSSRLDPATERLLEQAIDRLLANRTGILIAHRLSTVQRTDVIVILENGRIIEYGRRALLAADPNSRFAQLLQTGLAEVLV